MNRLIAIPATIAAIGTLAAPAAATDGNLYTYGPQANWLVGSQATITVPQPGTFQIELPAVATSLLGAKWAMEWGCPPGTEAAAVEWGGLRLAPPSSLAEEVLADGAVVYGFGDARLPQSPAPGEGFSAAIPSGHCVVTLRLNQTQQIAQHRRVYWVGQPRATFRDLTPPSVTLQSIAPTWVNAASTGATIAWSASDNFASDGMLTQSVVIGGIQKWTGSPGQGSFAITADLGGLLDGPNPVQVAVAGDGTSRGTANGTLLVDRTPPAASPPVAVATGDAGTSGFDWQTADATSGVAASGIEINSATDGSVTGTWIAIGPERPGAGPVSHFSESVATVPDGVHAVRARVRDIAGNVGYSAVSRMIIDTTRPVVTIAPVDPTPRAAIGVVVTLADNLAAAHGLGATLVEANTAPDGSATGQWVVVRPSEVLAAGVHTLQLDLGTLGDGAHLVRVTTANGGPYGERLSVSATAVVQVDATSPTLTDVGFTRAGPDRWNVGWIATDARSGVASASVDWADGSIWRPLVSGAASNGVGSLTIDTTQIPPGGHQIRLVVSDRAGNRSVAQGPIGGVVVDHTPPAITGFRLSGGPPWSVSWDLLDPGPGACATQLFVNGPGTGGVWRELGTFPSTAGAHTVAIPVEGLGVGAYRVRVSVCDAVGNAATVETAGLVIAGPDSAAVHGGRDDRLTAARLTVAVPGAKARAVAGRSVVTVRLVFGGRVALVGRLSDAAGRAIAGQRVAIVSAGATIGTAVTDGTGAFRTRVRPTRSGPLRLGVPVDGELLPGTQSTDVQVKVLPIVSFRASARTAVALGAPIVFSGRVLPSASALGRTERKMVVLEWRDPIRGTWRPVVNQRTAADGSFRIAWRFQASGQRFPMRVRVPYELGWGLESRTSAPVTVTVR